MHTSRRAIIIGGGIAGPALALFLQRAGISARVYEAHPRAENVGGGFQIAPNGVRALAALGLRDAAMQGGTEASAFCFHNHRGRLLARVRTDRAGPAVTTTRAAFYGVLLDAVARAGLTIEYGKRLREITTEGHEVVAHFEDGTHARGDFLVGADGVHSRVRALILPDHAAPRYSGMLGLGAFVGPGARPPEDPQEAHELHFVLGPKFQFGYTRMSGRWGWWCHLPQETELSRAALRALPDAELLERTAQAFAGWSAPVADFVANTEQVIRTAIYDVPSLPTWHRGRVLLIGDAAHAMSPAGGQGASMALEDAQVLSEILATPETPLAEAFADFERVRRPRVEPIIAEARENDQRSLKEVGAFGGWMRDRMFPLLAPVIARSLERRYTAPLR